MDALYVKLCKAIFPPAEEPDEPDVPLTPQESAELYHTGFGWHFANRVVDWLEGETKPPYAALVNADRRLDKYYLKREGASPIKPQVDEAAKGINTLDPQIVFKEHLGECLTRGPCPPVKFTHYVAHTPQGEVYTPSLLKSHVEQLLQHDINRAAKLAKMLRNPAKEEELTDQERFDLDSFLVSRAEIDTPDGYVPVINILAEWNYEKLQTMVRTNKLVLAQMALKNNYCDINDFEGRSVEQSLTEFRIEKTIDSVEAFLKLTFSDEMKADLKELLKGGRSRFAFAFFSIMAPDVLLSTEEFWPKPLIPFFKAFTCLKPEELSATDRTLKFETLVRLFKMDISPTKEQALTCLEALPELVANFAEWNPDQFQEAIKHVVSAVKALKPAALADRFGDDWNPAQFQTVVQHVTTALPQLSPSLVLNDDWENWHPDFLKAITDTLLHNWTLDSLETPAGWDPDQFQAISQHITDAMQALAVPEAIYTNFKKWELRQFQAAATHIAGALISSSVEFASQPSAAGGVAREANPFGKARSFVDQQLNKLKEDYPNHVLAILTRPGFASLTEKNLGRIRNLLDQKLIHGPELQEDRELQKDRERQQRELDGIPSPPQSPEPVPPAVETTKPPVAQATRRRRRSSVEKSEGSQGDLDAIAKKYSSLSEKSPKYPHHLLYYALGLPHRHADLIASLSVSVDQMFVLFKIAPTLSEGFFSQPTFFISLLNTVFPSKWPDETTLYTILSTMTASEETDRLFIKNLYKAIAEEPDAPRDPSATIPFSNYTG